MPFHGLEPHCTHLHGPRSAPSIPPLPRPSVAVYSFVVGAPSLSSLRGHTHHYVCVVVVLVLQPIASLQDCCRFGWCRRARILHGSPRIIFHGVKNRPRGEAPAPVLAYYCLCQFLITFVATFAFLSSSRGNSRAAYDGRLLSWLRCTCNTYAKLGRHFRSYSQCRLVYKLLSAVLML